MTSYSITIANTTNFVTTLDSYYARDSSGQLDGASATWDSDDDYGDFVLEDYYTAALTPKAVAFAGNNYVYTQTGTITEIEYYDSSLGRTLPSFGFVDTTYTTEALVATLLDQATTTPNWTYGHLE